MTAVDFTRRSTHAELTDDLTLEGDASVKNMRELEAVNFWLGGKKTLISALNEIYQKNLLSFINKKTVFADLGCGGGDLLRDIHTWAGKRDLNVNLLGIDANPFIIQYAVKNSQGFNNIEFKTLNVWSAELKTMQFDVVCLNSFCHHFNDSELIAFLKQMKEQTNIAIVINDLHRHWFAYLSIKWLSRLLNFSYLSKHDGPMSVLRAFQKHELAALLNSANIDHYEIQRRWAFRWRVIIWTK